jgi:hypothetical protein
MHPVTFVKNHPLATVVLLGVGYWAVPAITGFVQNKTGVGVTIPQTGG